MYSVTFSLRLGFYRSLETSLGDRRGAERAPGTRGTGGYHFLTRWLVPALQSLFLLLGQGETVRGLVDRHGQLSVDGGEGRVRDIPSPESAADDHAECVRIDILDVGGGFDDAASDDAGLLPGQLGGTERIGEDVVVQTRDTTEPIDRDGTGFIVNSQLKPRY
jgi:hypothetical protein